MVIVEQTTASNKYTPEFQNSETVGCGPTDCSVEQQSQTVGCGPTHRSVGLPVIACAAAVDLSPSAALLPDSPPDFPDSDSDASTPAKRLTPQQRQLIGLEALSGTASIHSLSARFEVSRNFVRQQRDLAQAALDAAFCPPPKDPEKVIRRLPITKNLLRMTVLVLVLNCHSSLRGAQEFLLVVLGCSASLGWIHSVVRDNALKAKGLNALEKLGAVRIAGLDEIFQCAEPILTVVEPCSAYCCLLVTAEHRDGTTWGVHLLDIKDKGFDPDVTISDAASGIENGLQEVFPDKERRMDHYHAIADSNDTSRFLDNRAYRAIAEVDRLQKQCDKKPQDQDKAQKLQQSKEEMNKAIELADDVKAAGELLRKDVLPPMAGTLEEREKNYDYLVKELKGWQSQCEHRLKPLIGKLENQKKGLLSYAERLEMEVSSLAGYAGVQEEDVWQMVELESSGKNEYQKKAQERKIEKRVGKKRFRKMKKHVGDLVKGTVRASSMVENLNSRLRCYFFMRREVGGDYLELLKFYLNHHRFNRSQKDRAGKSPAELLTGQEHPHWLEMLGFTPTNKAA